MNRKQAVVFLIFIAFMSALLDSEFSIQTVNFMHFETPPTWPKKIEKPSFVCFAEFAQSMDIHVPLSKNLGSQVESSTSWNKKYVQSSGNSRPVK